MFIRGIGIGVITAAALFYLTYFAIKQSETSFISDEVIIEKALELGMEFKDENLEE